MRYNRTGPAGRMKRGLLNLATAVSLVLGAAALLLFVLSPFVPFTRTFMRSWPLLNEVPKGRVQYELRSEPGGLTLLGVSYFETRGFSFLVWGPPVKPQRFTPDTGSTYDFGVVTVTRGMGTLNYGIGLTGVQVLPGVPYCRIELRYFALALLALAFPLTRLAVRRVRLLVREGRREDGLCPACGYDLRATPGRCPECGNAVAAK